MSAIGKVSPLCPHFLKTRGLERVSRGLKGIEKTKVRGQVVDKISKSLGFHAGDRGSNPLGDAKECQRVRVHSLALCCCYGGPNGGLFPREGSWCPSSRD
jgi:hypothetical protein